MLEVSVVITCFNLQDYIGEAIRSVLSQDLPPKEIIVVDDCSTDGSQQVIRSFSSVIYVRTPVNSGVLLATVLGIEHASADILCFLDGDDVWLPEKLSSVVQEFSRDERISLVTHDLVYVDQAGTEISRTSQVSKVLGQTNGDGRELVRRGILTHGDYVWLGSAYSVRRSMGKVNEFCLFAKSLACARDTYQDWPLAFWVAAQTGTLNAYVPQKLFRYRLHQANHSGDARSTEKAIRNVVRTLNTTTAILDIAGRFHLEDPVVSATRSKIAYYGYLRKLYQGKRASAALEFACCFRYVCKNQSVPKEIVRFLGVQLLGLENFLRTTERAKRVARFLISKRQRLLSR
jgi:glycosyltransferase involved in cell wall biosynthesis